MAQEQSKMDGFVKSILSELKQMVTTETVVGEPLKVEDKTVVPVIKFSVGFGAGGGEGTGEAPVSKDGTPSKGTGSGQGGGGGIKVDPVAFLTVHDGKPVLLPVSKRGANLEKLVDAVPDLVEKIQAIRDKKEDKKADK